MTSIKHRTAALLLAALMAAAAAFAASATFAADDADAKVKWVVGPEVV